MFNRPLPGWELRPGRNCVAGPCRSNHLGLFRVNGMLASWFFFWKLFWKLFLNLF